jgi:hypothetical protein
VTSPRSVRRVQRRKARTEHAERRNSTISFISPSARTGSLD